MSDLVVLTNQPATSLFMFHRIGCWSHCACDNELWWSLEQESTSFACAPEYLPATCIHPKKHVFASERLACRTLLQAAQSGNAASAEQTLQAMAAAGLTPGPRAWHALVFAYARAGDAEGSLRAIQSESQAGGPLLCQCLGWLSCIQERLHDQSSMGAAATVLCVEQQLHHHHSHGRRSNWTLPARALGGSCLLRLYISSICHEGCNANGLHACPSCAHISLLPCAVKECSACRILISSMACGRVLLRQRGMRSNTTNPGPLP